MIRRVLVVLGLALLVNCSGGGVQPSVDLAAASVDLTPPPPAFGEPCAEDGSCGDGLFCLPGPLGGAFCSKTCAPGHSTLCQGAPEGAAAYCLVTDVNAAGDKGCAFVCALGERTYACPGALVCAANEEPPGSGQRLCLPQ